MLAPTATTLSDLGLHQLDPLIARHRVGTPQHGKVAALSVDLQEAGSFNVVIATELVNAAHRRPRIGPGGGSSGSRGGILGWSESG